jgi:hypothetical protein
VNDVTAPAITAQAISATVECDGQGNSTELNTWLNNHAGATATDCNGVSWSNNFTGLSDDCGATGSATVTFYATDACGHSSSTTATFTIIDTQAPVINSPVTCGESITVNTDPGECDYTAGTEFDITATDACSGNVTPDWSITDANGTRNGSGSLAGVTFIPGSTSVTWTAEDDCGNSSTCSFDVIVKIATITTVYTSASAARYYDDVTLYAEVVTNCPNYPLTGYVEFFIDNVSVGSAPAFVIPAGEPGAGTTLRATLIHKITELPFSDPLNNPHTVKAEFTPTNDNYVGSQDTCKLRIYPRDASPFTGSAGFYTGPLFAWTTGPNSSTATITLTAVVQDNNVPDGDVRGAKVTFYYFDNGNLSPIPSAQNLPVDLIDETDGTIGAASAIVQFNIGNWNALEFYITVGISGGYTNNPYDPESQALVTVSKPLEGGYIVGGGEIENSANTVGLIKGAIGAEYNTEYSFDVSYNKKGTNPKGKATLKIYSWYGSDGILDTIIHTYIVQSNAIATLAVNKPSESQAYFSSKATLKEQMPDGSMVSLEGNNTFQIWVTDPGNDGGDDGTIGVQLNKKAGGIWFSSNWNGTKTTEVPPVAGSEIKVAPASAAKSAETEIEAPVITGKFEVSVYPNPSNGPVTFEFQLSESAITTIDIYTSAGTLITHLFEDEVEAGTTRTVTFDQKLPEGTYYYKLQSGNYVKTGKFIIAR